MTITIDEERAQKLREHAKRQGISPEELLKQTVDRFLIDDEEDIDQIILETIQDNAELYRRLA